MNEQTELFQPDVAPEPPDDEPPEWMVKILEPAVRKIINQARGTKDYHPEDRRRWAKDLAVKLADAALDEVALIAMMNEQDDESGVS
jgi:hypothetical protein